MTSKEDYSVIYQGAKVFWKTNQSIEIVMARHAAGVIEIILYETVLELEVPRIYVDLNSAITKLNFDEIGKLVAVDKELLIRRRKEINEEDLLRKHTQEAAIHFILARIAKWGDDPLAITLVPITGDKPHPLIPHAMECVCYKPHGLVCYRPPNRRMRNIRYSLFSNTVNEIRGDAAAMQEFCSNATTLLDGKPVSPSAATAAQLSKEERKQQKRLKKAAKKIGIINAFQVGKRTGFPITTSDDIILGNGEGAAAIADGGCVTHKPLTRRKSIDDNHIMENTGGIHSLLTSSNDAYNTDLRSGSGRVSGSGRGSRKHGTAGKGGGSPLRGRLRRQRSRSADDFDRDSGDSSSSGSNSDSDSDGSSSGSSSSSDSDCEYNIYGSRADSEKEQRYPGRNIQPQKLPLLTSNEHKNHVNGLRALTKMGSFRFDAPGAEAVRQEGAGGGVLLHGPKRASKASQLHPLDMKRSPKHVGDIFDQLSPPNQQQQQQQSLSDQQLQQQESSHQQQQQVVDGFNEACTAVARYVQNTRRFIEECKPTPKRHVVTSTSTMNAAPSSHHSSSPKHSSNRIPAAAGPPEQQRSSADRIAAATGSSSNGNSVHLPSLHTRR